MLQGKEVVESQQRRVKLYKEKKPSQLNSLCRELTIWQVSSSVLKANLILLALMKIVF